MKFDAILEDQQADLKLRKVYEEIDKSELGKSLERARNEFNNAKSRVADSEKAAEALVNMVNNAERLYADGVKAYEEIAAKLDGAESEDERATCIARLEAIRKKLSEIEKKLGEVKPRAEKTIKEYRAGQETGKRMRVEYGKAKEALEQLKKEKEPIIEQYKKTLAALKTSIDPALMEQYNALKAEGKPIAIVEAIIPDKGNSAVYCRGCGIELPQKLKSELLESGQCRCEKCRRIIITRK